MLWYVQLSRKTLDSMSVWRTKSSGITLRFTDAQLYLTNTSIKTYLYILCDDPVWIIGPHYPLYLVSKQTTMGIMRSCDLAGCMSSYPDDMDHCSCFRHRFALSRVDYLQVTVKLRHAYCWLRHKQLSLCHIMCWSLQNGRFVST